MATNQGPSSTQDNVVKSPVIMPKPDNLAGNESGNSTTAGCGTTAGQSTDSVEYKISDVNQRNGTQQPYLNISASGEDLSAKWQNREQDIPDAGRNQYQ